jgi:hypothetical protein
MTGKMKIIITQKIDVCYLAAFTGPTFIQNPLVSLWADRVSIICIAPTTLQTFVVSTVVAGVLIIHDYRFPPCWIAGFECRQYVLWQEANCEWRPKSQMSPQNFIIAFLRSGWFI